MPEKTYDVLFVCNDNAARSILAEGLLRQLGRGLPIDKLDALSLHREVRDIGTR